MTATAVRMEARDGVVWITLDGEPQLNSLAGPTMAALATALTTAEADESTRVVVLTGAGRAFSAGADLARLSPDHESVMRVANALIRQITQLEIPVIAAVNGVAVGYGVSLVAAADVALAAESASFLIPFGALGLMPDGGLTHTLPAAVGRALAGEITFTGGTLSSMVAATTGLVSRTVPDDDLLDAVTTLARTISHTPRRTLNLTKQALNGAWEAHLDQALERERSGQIELLGTPEFAERSAPFL